MADDKPDTPAPRWLPGAESSDPEVHQLLAQRQAILTAVGEGQRALDAANAAEEGHKADLAEITRQLHKLGVK
jgi:hypothetical protein